MPPTKVEEFLLYFFTQSAHASSRGFWMTPESTSITVRTHNVWYSAAGPNNVPLCIKVCEPRVYAAAFAQAATDYLRFYAVDAGV